MAGMGRGTWRRMRSWRRYARQPSVRHRWYAKHAVRDGGASVAWEMFAVCGVPRHHLEAVCADEMHCVRRDGRRRWKATGRSAIVSDGRREVGPGGRASEAHDQRLAARGRRLWDAGAMLGDARRHYRQTQPDLVDARQTKGGHTVRRLDEVGCRRRGGGSRWGFDFSRRAAAAVKAARTAFIHRSARMCWGPRNQHGQLEGRAQTAQRAMVFAVPQVLTTARSTAVLVTGSQPRGTSTSWRRYIGSTPMLMTETLHNAGGQGVTRLSAMRSTRGGHVGDGEP